MTDPLGRLAGEVDDAGSDAVHALMREFVALTGAQVPDFDDPADLAAAALAAATNATVSAVGSLGGLASDSLRGEVSARRLAASAAGLLSASASLYLLAGQIEAGLGDSG